jgi:multimeric flavodoxin WrbA
VLKDDITGVFAAVERSDAVIFASPLYFLNVTAQAKMFIDRFHCRWIAYNVLGQKRPALTSKGVFICVAGSADRSQADCARKTIRAFFNTLGIGYRSEIYCGGMEEKGGIFSRKDEISKAYKMGARLVLA